MAHNRDDGYDHGATISCAMKTQGRKGRSSMKQRTSAAMAAVMAIGIAAMAVLAPRPALAQLLPTGHETRSVPFGDAEIVLYAPPGSALLDANQPVDELLAAVFFRPRAGKMNTYLGAFVERKELEALRSKRSAAVLNFGYYLAPTFAAGNPVAQPREAYLRGLCDSVRARSGSLDLTAESARHEIEAKMRTLPIGQPWFGPVVAHDENGCYQIVLYKRAIPGAELGEILVTSQTMVKRRPVIYTRSTQYFSGVLPAFLYVVQSDVAAYAKSNP
jgi:hypothetical protein